MTAIVDAIYSLYERTTTPRRRTPTASDGLASLCERYAWYEANSPRSRVISSLLARRMKYGSVHEDCIREELRILQDSGSSRIERGHWQIKGAGYRLTLW